jgi:hypothetical protein
VVSFLLAFPPKSPCEHGNELSDSIQCWEIFSTLA